MFKKIAMLAFTVAVITAVGVPSAEAGESTPLPDDGPDWGCDPSLRDGPEACPRDVRKRWLRHKEQLQLLEEVIEKEGEEYSPQKYRGYIARIVWGACLMPVGAAGLVYAAAYGLSRLLEESTGHADPAEESEQQATNDLGPPGVGIGTFIGGLVTLAIGVSLTLSGAKGKNRQKVLLRKDEILEPFSPFGVSVSFFSNRRLGALCLSVAF